MKCTHKWKELFRTFWRNPWGEYRYVGKCCAQCGAKKYSRPALREVDNSIAGAEAPHWDE